MWKLRLASLSSEYRTSKGTVSQPSDSIARHHVLQKSLSLSVCLGTAVSESH